MEFMSIIKLGTYRKHATIQRKKHKITNLDFDVVLYAAQKTWVTQYDLLKDVTNSRTSIIKSLTYLVERGFMKVAQENTFGKRAVSRKYVITAKGRKMVTDFYFNIGFDL